MTTQITEYWVNPLDDDGDVIENHFFDTKQEARKAVPGLRNVYRDACDWEFLKVVRRYADDGNLIDEDVATLPERDFR